MDGRKHSLNLIGSGQGQSPPVFFYTIGTFENIIHISFYIFENQKIVYTEPTLVLIRVCQTWAMHHADIPTTLPELSSPIQSQWSEIKSLHMRPLSQVIHRDP